MKDAEVKTTKATLWRGNGEISFWTLLGVCKHIKQQWSRWLGFEVPHAVGNPCAIVNVANLSCRPQKTCVAFFLCFIPDVVESNLSDCYLFTMLIVAAVEWKSPFSLEKILSDKGESEIIPCLSLLSPICCSNISWNAWPSSLMRS